MNEQRWRSRSSAIGLIVALTLAMIDPAATTAAHRTELDAECAIAPPVVSRIDRADRGANLLPDPISAMSLERKIGQMLMAGVQNAAIGDDERRMIERLHVGNVILMGHNVESPAQVLALTQGLQEVARSSGNGGLLIATDQEGGLVQRLRPAAGFTLLPEAATVGLARCPSQLRDYGRIAGEEPAAVGINMTMAPVLDVANNPVNPVIAELGRSFGTTPEQVIEAAIPFAVGLAEAGVIATGKHFPGHGGTTTDSHNSLPFVEKDRAALDAVELAPYRAAVEAGFEAMMPAHVAFTALDSSGLPATVSAPIQTGLLREELGFGGVIVTDDMGMAGITSRFPPGEAAVRAVEAGADIVLCVRMEVSGACPPDMLEQMRDGLLRAVADGRLSRERIGASVRRVLDLKSRHAVGPADGSGLDRIKGAGHIRVIAEVLAKIADRLEASGQP